jgi:signal peptidase complex subunit 3
MCPEILKLIFLICSARELMRLNRGKLELKNQKPKYQITAPTGKLAELDDVVLKVHYNVQPWVGILTWTPQIKFGNWNLMKGGISKVFKLPALKKKDEKKGTT